MAKKSRLKVSPRQRVMRIYERVQRIEDRLLAAMMRLEPEDRARFMDRHVRRLNAMRVKAVRRGRAVGGGAAQRKSPR